MGVREQVLFKRVPLKSSVLPLMDVQFLSGLCYIGCLQLETPLPRGPHSGLNMLGIDSAFHPVLCGKLPLTSSLESCCPLHFFPIKLQVTVLGFLCVFGFCF